MRASLGIAVAPEHGQTAGAILAAADAAMYQSKRDGGQTVALAGELRGLRTAG